MVKKACCNANAELNFIPPKKAIAISTACDEIAEGIEKLGRACDKVGS